MIEPHFLLPLAIKFAWLLPTCFTSKSYTTWEKQICHHSYYHNPGCVFFISTYAFLPSFLATAAMTVLTATIHTFISVPLCTHDHHLLLSPSIHTPGLYPLEIALTSVSNTHTFPLVCWDRNYWYPMSWTGHLMWTPRCSIIASMLVNQLYV